jgi:hypothetical protein
MDLASLTIVSFGFSKLWNRASNVEVTGPKLTADFDSRGGLRSEATTGARRTKLAVNLWSGAKTRSTIFSR